VVEPEELRLVILVHFLHRLQRLLLLALAGGGHFLERGEELGVQGLALGQNVGCLYVLFDLFFYGPRFLKHHFLVEVDCKPRDRGLDSVNEDAPLLAIQLLVLEQLDAVANGLLGLLVLLLDGWLFNVVFPGYPVFGYASISF